MMKQKTGLRGKSSEKIVKDIRRATRRRRSPEEKIRIVLDGLRGQAGRPSKFIKTLVKPVPDTMMDWRVC